MKFINKHKDYIIALVFMIVISAIFVNSFYWPVSGFSKRKLLVAFIVIFCVAVVPIMLIKVKFLNDIFSYFVNLLKSLCESIKANWKKVIIYMGVCVITTVAVLIFYICVIRFTNQQDNLYKLYLFLTIGYLGVTLFLLRKIATSKPEIIFSVIVLFVGIFFIKVSPAIVGVAWDDEIHYQRALNISNVINGVMYEADEKVVRDYASNIYAHACYDRSSKEVYISELNALYESKQISSRALNWHSFYSVAYIPAGIGIMFGRGIGLSWVGVFNFGRLFNLLTYTLIFAMAIKKIKYGKMLVACIGLIPTSIFMACSYTYDFWVIAMIVLSFAYFFSILQDKDGVIKTKDIIIMVTAMMIGCMPKAIYFPLLFPFLFICKDKFKANKQRIILWIYVIFAGLFLVATFLLPMLISGPGVGDTRGGSAVNSAEQISFILSNPMEYMDILMNFLKGYLSLDNSMGYTQMFAYVGNGKYFVLVIAVILIMALWNKEQIKEHIPVIRITGLIAVAGAFILVPTALYISFTPVGLNTVLGCQYRYILPVLFPLLYLLCGTGNQREPYKAREVVVPMVIIATTFLINMNNLCVSLY